MIASLKRAMLRTYMRRIATGKQSAKPERVRNIALWQFGGVGDMLLATPVINALHEAYPEAEIAIFCSTPAFADFLQRFPNVSMVRAFPVYDFDSRTLLHGDMRRALRAIGDTMAEQQPDVLVCLHVAALLDWWVVEWWLIRRLSPGFSLGFDPRFIHGRSVFDVSLNAAERDGIHYTRLYRLLLEKAGISCGETTYFPMADEEMSRARLLLTEAMPDAKRVCLHLGARRLKVEGKMWPLDHFVALAGKLLEAGFVPVLIGVESEREMADVLCARLPQCINLIGRTTLGEMAAVIAQCGAFLGQDSGPFHVAVAVGTPSVTICGRPDAEPEYLDYRRRDVTVLTAADPARIDVDSVFEAAMRILAHD